MVCSRIIVLVLLKVNYSIGNSAKSSPKDENKPIVEENVEEQKKNISASASAFFTSAWNKVGTFSASSNNTACVTSKSPEATEENSKNDEEETTEEQKSYFSNFSNMVGKVANNASTAIKDKVGNVGMIGEFNKQQEDFIKNKGMKKNKFYVPRVLTSRARWR